jgi:hypothetical protein
MHDFALQLSADTSRSLTRALTRLATEAGLRWVAVIDEAGFVLAQHGEANLRDDGEKAVLANATFAAARELARQLDENDFAGLHYQGRDRHFYLAPLTAQTLLAGVFGNDTPIAIVRTWVQKLAPELATAVRQATQPAPLADFHLRLATTPVLAR